MLNNGVTVPVGSLPPCACLRIFCLSGEMPVSSQLEAAKQAPQTPHSDRPSSGVLVATAYQGHQWKIVGAGTLLAFVGCQKAADVE